jgi:hypothetical protein
VKYLVNPQNARCNNKNWKGVWAAGTNTWEIAGFTITRKWNWLFVIVAKANSPDFNRKGIFNLRLVGGKCINVLGD